MSLWLESFIKAMTCQRLKAFIGCYKCILIGAELC